MANEASTVWKLVDEVTPTLSSVKKSMAELEKEFPSLARKAQDLQAQNRALSESYAKVAAEAEAAKNELNAAKKAFKENGDEINKTNLEQATLKYKALTDQMKDFKSASSDVQKEIKNVQNEMRKLDGGGSGSGSGSGSGGSGKDPLSGWSAGLSAMAKQLSGSAASMASYYLSSSLGTQDAGLVSSIISGIGSGASAGMLTGSPWGVAIGAVAGGISGLISGATANQQAEDDFFKSYRNDLINEVAAGTAESLTSGSAIAATREQNQLAFAALLGSSGAASGVLGDITSLANRTPYLYDDLVTIAKQLSVYGYGAGGDKDIISTLTNIGNAGAAIGWNTSDMATVAQQLGFMGELEKVGTEQIKQLQRKGLSVYDWLGAAYGTDASGVNKLLSSGDISGDAAASIILSGMAEKFDGSMEAQSQTFAGLSSTIEGLQQELDNAMGDAYNAARVSGLQKQVAFLSSSGMNEALTIIGNGHALADNYKEAVSRDVMSGVFDGNEEFEVVDEAIQEEIKALRAKYLDEIVELEGADEQTQQEIAANVEGILNDAKELEQGIIDASAALDAWDQAALETADYAGRILALLESHADDWAYKQTLSKGLGAANGKSRTSVSAAPTAISGTNANYSVDAAGNFALTSFKRASGQRIVPYDNFLISAHEGEMLLTAAEARAYRAGGSARAVVTGNTFYVRKDSDIDAIAEALALKIEQAERVMR